MFNTNSVGACNTGFESLSLSQEEKESIPANRKANIEIFFISLLFKDDTLIILRNPGSASSSD